MGPSGWQEGWPRAHSSPFQLQPLETLRGTRNLVFISGECERFCHSEWTFDSGWRWNLSRTSEFCFVLFFSYKMGQALLAYVSPNYTGNGRLPNLLTSNINSWGRQEGHPRPFGFIDPEVLLKMLCFLEVCPRPNKKPSQGGAHQAKGIFTTWKTAHLDLLSPTPVTPRSGLHFKTSVENPIV